MRNPLLSAESITVRFGGVVALDKVSLAVDEGSFVGLVGPNGAGKTTMFGVLSGLIRPNSGKVAIDGAVVTRSTPQRRANLGVSRTFQRLELFGELTVREHLVLAYRVRQRRDRSFFRDLVGLGNRPSPGEDVVVDELLRLLTLRDVANRPAVLLPLGTGRLVEVGRALAGSPRVVLLDEPTSGVSTDEKHGLMATIMAALDAQKVTAIFVEHDVDIVSQYATRVAAWIAGRIAADGTLQEVLADPEVRKNVIGE